MYIYICVILLREKTRKERHAVWIKAISKCVGPQGLSWPILSALKRHHISTVCNPSKQTNTMLNLYETKHQKSDCSKSATADRKYNHNACTTTLTETNRLK